MDQHGKDAGVLGSRAGKIWRGARRRSRVATRQGGVCGEGSLSVFVVRRDRVRSRRGRSGRVQRERWEGGKRQAGSCECAEVGEVRCCELAAEVVAFAAEVRSLQPDQGSSTEGVRRLECTGVFVIALD